MTGKVKMIAADRGFWFVSGDDGKEYFFHRSSVEGSFDDLAEGSAVSFEGDSAAAKGPRANWVRLTARAHGVGQLWGVLEDSGTYGRRWGMKVHFPLDPQPRLVRHGSRHQFAMRAMAWC